MLILAFDTTVAACSVALTHHPGATIARAREFMEQGQAEALVPMVERVMGDANAAYADLDRIAVTVGPGSFTGVRVGLAAARALGLAADKPVIGVSSLEALAAAVPDGERDTHDAILAAIDTKRGEIYVQTFEARTLRAKSAPVALPPGDIAAWVNNARIVAVGDAAKAVVAAAPHATLSGADAFPDPVVIAHLAAERAPDTSPVPLYVLPPKITLAPGGGRLRP
ncbi:MAG: tRNA (adenosine(37)-N6)-threonylcarbamoyltransferase complex dimerization subunit type 1 TsaB [Rhodospirillaceae bacterium]